MWTAILESFFVLSAIRLEAMKGLVEECWIRFLFQNSWQLEILERKNYEAHPDLSVQQAVQQLQPPISSQSAQNCSHCISQSSRGNGESREVLSKYNICNFGKFANSLGIVPVIKLLNKDIPSLSRLDKNKRQSVRRMKINGREVH